MDDFDIDLDSADRISQRMAHGVYRITHGQKAVGEELWGIFGLRSGGYRLMSEIDLKWPVQNKQRAKLDLDANWIAKKLWVEMDIDTRRRLATYTPDLMHGMVAIHVAEMPLRYAEANKSRNDETSFSLNAPDKGKAVYEDELPFDGQSYLDFASTLFNFAHLKRIGSRLQESNKAKIKAIVVKLPSLEPLTLKQTYEYVTDEPIGENQQLAHCYTITESEGGSAKTTFWCNNRGIILKQQVTLNNQQHGCDLTSYRWLGGS